MSVGPCVNTPPVHGVVVFDPAAFILLYPEFAGIPSQALTNNFTRATLQLNNTCQSRVQDATLREMLLGLLTAHITIISNGTNNGGSPPITTPPLGVIGRVSNATEGSVSVGVELQMSGNPSMPYYSQTKYGLEYWQATARFRQAVYVPPPCQPGVGNNFGPGFGFGNRWPFN